MRVRFQTEPLGVGSTLHFQFACKVTFPAWLCKGATFTASCSRHVKHLLSAVLFKRFYHPHGCIQDRIVLSTSDAHLILNLRTKVHPRHVCFVDIVGSPCCWLCTGATFAASCSRHGKHISTVNLWKGFHPPHGCVQDGIMLSTFDAHLI